MKNFKMAVVSLSVLFILSVFIISCEQETPTEDLIESISDPLVKAKTYVLPKGLEDKPPSEIISYVDNLSDNELEKLAENYRIKIFLDQENLYKTMYSQLKEGQLFVDMNLNQLTSEQLQRLNSFSIDDVISSRDCYTTPAYPMYKCQDPSWCGDKNRIERNCDPDRVECSSSHTNQEHVWQQYCGYPNGELVNWMLYYCTYSMWCD